MVEVTGPEVAVMVAEVTVAVAVVPMAVSAMTVAVTPAADLLDHRVRLSHGLRALGARKRRGDGGAWGERRACKDGGAYCKNLDAHLSLLVD